MKIKIYSQSGEIKGEKEIKNGLFSQALNPILLHEAVVMQLSNSREASAKTKTRAQVAGGGKKPWRQKGTGRARTGSIRNPIWRGGGIIFGPTGSQSYKQKMTRKKLRQALISALISKKSQIVEIEKLNVKKTREAEKIIEKINTRKNALIIFDGLKKEDGLAFGNLKMIKTVDYRNINIFDVMKYHQLIFVGDALEKTIDSIGVN